MQIYIALLKGINVGGHNKIKMQELKNMLVSLQFRHIETYIQSGNIVFEYDDKPTEQIEADIHKAILAHFNLNIAVFVKTLPEWKEILANNPYLLNNDAELEKIYYTILSNEPTQANIDKLELSNVKHDTYTIHHKTLYLYCATNYSDALLSNSFIEQKMKLTATTRNHKTMTHLLQIAETLHKA